MKFFGRIRKRHGKGNKTDLFSLVLRLLPTHALSGVFRAHSKEKLSLLIASILILTACEDAYTTADPTFFTREGGLDFDGVVFFEDSGFPNCGNAYFQIREDLLRQDYSTFSKLRDPEIRVVLPISRVNRAGNEFRSQNDIDLNSVNLSIEFLRLLYSESSSSLALAWQQFFREHGVRFSHEVCGLEKFDPPACYGQLRSSEQYYGIDELVSLSDAAVRAGVRPACTWHASVGAIVNEFLVEGSGYGHE